MNIFTIINIISINQIWVNIPYIDPMHGLIKNINITILQCVSRDLNTSPRRVLGEGEFLSWNISERDVRQHNSLGKVVCILHTTTFELLEHSFRIWKCCIHFRSLDSLKCRAPRFFFGGGDLKEQNK